MEHSQKPHAVCIPYPAQGHITPMLKLAKILHSKGFHITFVNTEFNHARLVKSRGPNSLNSVPSFRFEAIPDGLPPSDPDATQDTTALCEATTKYFLLPFKNLLCRLEETSPPVTCIFSDFIMNFTLKAAKELSIPIFLLWTASACGLLGYLQYTVLVEKGLVPLKDKNDLTNGYLDMVIDWVPSMAGIHLKDLPTHMRTTDPKDFMLNLAIVVTEDAKQASGVIINTFEELDADILDALSSTYTSIYAIGPLHSLQYQIIDNNIESIGSNLWKEELECLEWLDSKEANSVVYVNFGSITVMTTDQLVEFCWGLSQSNQTFLWIIRPDLVSGDSATLPPEFLKETKERRMLASWCPQEKVLCHPSIGGFLTHCGWNSTIESVTSGVPMICWPFFSEQQTNCWFSCNKWGIGMEIDNDVKRDEVAKLVAELMAGEKGKKMKKNAIEWKKKAEQACIGSSYVNLENMIRQLVASPNQ